MSVSADMGHLPSPAPKKLQYDLHHLADHAPTAQFVQPMYGPDGEIYLPSNQQTYFDSTTDVYKGIVDFSRSPYNDPIFMGGQYPVYGEQGLGIQYGSYELPTAIRYVPESSIPRSIPFTPPTLRENTPSTPQSTASNLTRKTRSSGKSSGPVLRSNVNKEKLNKPTRTKATRQKTNSARAPHIDKPLSELTKDLTNVPIRDMDEWVHRSDEVRQREVEKRNGYIARPMNSFMLYRSAYAERTKVWCVQNNHQVVSAVSGESWPMEPPEIREKYNELAKIERDNHAKAHPNYKFTPSKGGQVKRKKDDDSDEESDDSDIADNDSEWKPRSERHGNSRKIKRQAREESQLSDSPLHNRYRDPYYAADNGMNTSSWDAASELRPFPGFLEQWEPYSQYYESTAYPLVSAAGIGGVPLHTMPLPPSHYGGMPNGLPGTYHSDLLEFRSQQPTPVSYESQVDPILGHLDDHNSPFDGTNLFDDHHGPLHAPSQFEEWMEAEEKI